MKISITWPSNYLIHSYSCYFFLFTLGTKWTNEQMIPRYSVTMVVWWHVACQENLLPPRLCCSQKVSAKTEFQYLFQKSWKYIKRSIYNIQNQVSTLRLSSDQYYMRRNHQRQADERGMSQNRAVIFNVPNNQASF